MSLSYLDVSTWRNLGSRHLYRSVPIYKNFSFSLEGIGGSGSDEHNAGLSSSLSDLDLDDFIVCGAPFGGPIAITKDIAKLTALKASGPAAFGQLTIFSASGKYLGSCTMHSCEGGGNSASAAFGLGGSPRFLGMAWTSAETLACIFEDGSVDQYDARANYLATKSFSLLPSLSRDRLDSFATCGGGMAAIIRKEPTSSSSSSSSSASSSGPSFSLVAVYDWQDPLPVTLHSAVGALESSAIASGAIDAFPTAIACIDGQYAADGRMEVLLGTPDRSIVVVEASDTATDQQLDAILSSVVRMIAVSPSGRYLAAFGEDGSVTVTDTAFERKLVEFQTKAVTRPTQLAWCGEDAVAVTWPDRGVLLIGPSGDYLCFSYSSLASGQPMLGVEPDEAAAALEAMQLSAAAATTNGTSSNGNGNGTGFGPPLTMAMHVVQEQDCLRVVGPHFHELLQRVPGCVVAVRSIGSTAPSATLMSSNAKFEAGDADCDELLRGLMAEDTLKEAVSECIAAACAEWEPSNQQALLRGASYGKACDPDFDAAVFVDACKQLRLLNALRSHTGGMPLTLAQLETLTPSVVVDRLCARHSYRLALEVCEYLGLQRDRERALVHWACAKVKYAKATESDESLRDKIRSKLAPISSSSNGSGSNPVSYADIAAAADSAGRRRLATMLLSFEPRVADQVPILLKMREGPLALEKALESGDADLVHLALLHLRQLYVAKDRVAKAARDSAFSSKRSRLGSSSEAAALAVSSGLADDDAADEDDDDESATKTGHEAFLKIVLAYPAAVDALAAWYSHRYFSSLQASTEKSSSSRSSSFNSTGRASASAFDKEDLNRSKPQGRGLGSLLRLYKSAGRYCDAGRQLLNAAAVFSPRPSAGHASHTSIMANNLATSGNDTGSSTLVTPFFSHPDVSLHISFLQRAVAIFKEGEKAPLSSDTKAAALAAAQGIVPVTASERADCAFYRSSTEEQLQLLLLQVDMDRDLDPNSLTAVPLTAAASQTGVKPPPATARFSFVGLPLAETMAALVRLSGGDSSSDASKRVMMLKEAFKMPDQAFVFLRVDALAAGRDWVALQRLSEEKRGGPIIGYKPFVEACMAANAPIEARKYASKISDYNEKMEALIASGGYTEAAEAATKAKDIDRLNQLGSLARTPAAVEAVEKGLAMLGAR